MCDSLQVITGQPRCFPEAWFRAFTSHLSPLMQMAVTWFLLPSEKPWLGMGLLPLKQPLPPVHAWESWGCCQPCSNGAI